MSARSDALPEAIQGLLDGYAKGSIVWDEVFGLIEAVELGRVHEAQRAQAMRAHQGAQIPTKHKIGLALTVGLSIALVLLLVWFFESRR